MTAAQAVQTPRLSYHEQFVHSWQSGLLEFGLLSVLKIVWPGWPLIHSRCVEL